MRSYNQSKKNKNTTVLNTKKEANINSEKNINVNIQNPKDSISNRIFTIVIPSISTLIAAIMSMYVLNIAEKEKVNEKNQQADIKIIEAYTTQIKANTDQNKVILDYISLENEKGELAQEISDYKTEKGKLKDENTKLEHGIASLKLEKTKLFENNSNLRHENISLAIENSNLDDAIIFTKNELDFALINQNLRVFKKHPNPYNLPSYELIDYMSKKGRFTNRIIDSLHSYTKDSKLFMASLVLLHFGTKNPYYKDEYIKSMPIMLDTEYKGKCIEQYTAYTLTFDKWDTHEKNEITKILLEQYEKDTSKCFRETLLHCVARFASDSAFSLLDVGYNYYWDYLKYNRDLFFSYKAFQPDKILFNIASFSPQLFFAIIIYCSSNPSKTSIEMNQLINLYAMKGLTLIINELPFHKFEDVNLFATNMNINSNRKKFYYHNKDEIDSWIVGDFERFRNDKNEFEKCMNEKKF